MAYSSSRQPGGSPGGGGDGCGAVGNGLAERLAGDEQPVVDVGRHGLDHLGSIRAGQQFAALCGAVPAGRPTCGSARWLR